MVSLYIAEQTGKMVLEKDCNYNVSLLNKVNVDIGELPNKIQNAVLRRAKALLRSCEEVPPVDWWETVTGEIRGIYDIVIEAVLTIYGRGGSKEYYENITLELSEFKIENIEKICEYVIKEFDEAKSLPAPSFWLKAIKVVKMGKTEKLSYGARNYGNEKPASKDEVSKCVSLLRKKFGW